MPKDIIKRTDASPASLEDLAQRINQAHEGAIRSARTAIEHAIECGRLLVEAKALVAHGRWMPWLKANTAFSYDTAARWMRYAEHSERLLANFASMQDLTFAQLDRFLAGPKPETAPEPPPASTLYDAANEATASLAAYWDTVEETPEALVAAAPEVARLFDRAREAIQAARDHDDGEGIDDPFEKLRFYARVTNAEPAINITKAKLRAIRAIGCIIGSLEQEPDAPESVLVDDRLLAAPKAEPCEPAAPKFHPITEIIPMMRDDELHALADSIRAVGQIVPIVVDEKTNMIVDGRCRWRACEIAGVDPKIERREFADDRDVLDFIISMNVHRSHKTEDQCAMAAARLSERRRVASA